MTRTPSLSIFSIASALSLTLFPLSSVAKLNSDDQALGDAFEAHARKDASAMAKPLSSLSKNHLLRPWAQGWVLLDDPNSAPAALMAFSKKFPPSTMRWRLAQAAAAGWVKSGQLDAAAQAIATVPAKSLSPIGKCIQAIGQSATESIAMDLLAAGSGSEHCSQAVYPILGEKIDPLATAFFRLGAEKAKLAATWMTSRGSNSAFPALTEAFMDKSARASLNFPLLAREKASRDMASALGQGKCPARLPSPDQLTERGMANAARCALWLGQVKVALPYWKNLSMSQPNEPRWPLLAAMALGGDPQSIRAPDTSYVGLIQRAASKSPSPTPSASALPSSCDDLGAQIPLALWKSNLRKEAIEAWRDEIGRADAPRKSCMGLKSASMSAHPLRIAAFAGDSFDPRAYEAGFHDEITLAATSSKIDADLLISIARQESRFDAMAMSPAGASGLMQLMGPTARETADELRLTQQSSSDLFDPALNAKLGAFHFAKLFRQFDSNPAWALCAYNAGAGRCKSWKSKLSSLPTAFQIEAMPYDETRIYVERIMAGWSLTGSKDASRSNILLTGSAFGQPNPKPGKTPPASNARPRP